MLRACLVLLDRWATDGIAPPASRLPSRSEGTLVAPETVLGGLPRIPGVKPPIDAGRLPFYNYGPDFDRGSITVFPPEATPGQEYPIQVPQIDADGNELAGLRYPDIEVPLGTYTGWAVRKAGFGEGDLLSTSGSFIPFARTRAERDASADPRLSLEERYSSHAAYAAAIVRVVEGLVADRLMLQEDAERFIEAARQKNPLDPSVPLGPLLSGGE
jgi:hypothetical protein